MNAIAPIPTMRRAIGDLIAEPYQDRIMAEIAEAIRDRRSGAVLAPTGSGKSLFAAGAVEDALHLRIPILVLHPDIALLRQNLRQIQRVPAFAHARVSAYIAQNEGLDHPGFLRNTLETDVALATMMSIVNKLDDPAFIAQLRAFGRRGGCVLIDEGHKTAADKLGEALGEIAGADGIGIILTATPFRTDGRDPLAPFDARVERDLIAVASYDEVLATGRTVRTKFELAARDFEAQLGLEVTNLIEETFRKLVADKKSIDQASAGAFSRFFSEDASPSDSAIGDLIVASTIAIWRARAAGRRLAMIHCDSVAFARRLAETLADTVLPEGHAKAGHHPAVGFVVADETVVWRDGVELDVYDAFGGTKRSLREDLLAASRAGSIDVLVNVNALGTGTDVPITDLNILACRQRGLAPYKQLAGRGERSAPDKTHQLFVDIGDSTYSIFNDVDAMRRGNPERSRMHVRSLIAPIRAQFEAWFDADEDLAAQVADRGREIARRLAGAPSLKFEDEADATMAEAVLPSAPPIPFATGLYGLRRVRKDRLSERFLAKTALFWNLAESGVYTTDCEGLPPWLVAIQDEESQSTATRLCASLDDARLFASFMGVTPPLYPPVAAEPTTGQHKMFAALRYHLPNEPFLRPYRKPIQKADLSVVLDLLNKKLFIELMDAATRHLVQRGLGRHDFDFPLRSVVLTEPDKIATQQLALLGAWQRTRQRIAILKGDKALAATVVTYDPTTPNYVRDLFDRFETPLVVIDEPEQIDRARTKLAEGLALGRIVGLSPAGSADGDLRQKAGLKPVDKRQSAAAFERQKQFRSSLATIGRIENDLFHMSLTSIQARHGLDATQFKKGVGPIGAVVGALILLCKAADSAAAEAAVASIEQAIAQRLPTFEIALDLAHLASAYLQSPAPDQKQMHKLVKEAATFLARTASLRIPPA
ncbi:MAG TPA: DEAD/DEAH box helicase family protein [Beijerinckiaceae bacterium]|nr:DEAD/DEAH box helicase family protein [Rhodoblastus sp.]MCB1525545.1 DEAD/DEAH box helicase family protein [Rhodoblastus sp.]MCC2108370.1 DEAD/DEAH box helicase family protein [Hyphomicrobiales bacterium]MCO5086694.1 DEAD/DEAH box helicase family protein [Methylobacteriaceae bacterium]HRY01901.1 DEAD/DEAH box helicase family protein [Beijerinckiaceae bacterium]